MKLKNILSIICCLVAMASCSMEDDVLNEMGNSQKNVTEVADANAYVAFKVAFSTGNMTKGSVETAPEEAPASEKESKIDHCSLILADAAGNVLFVDDKVSVNANNEVVASSTTDEIIKHMVKVGRKYQVMIIANSENQFAGSTSISAIESRVQETFPDYLVKIGRGEADLTNVEGYASTTESAENPIFVPVTLYQLAARIELAGFTVKEFACGTEQTDVVINRIEVTNINKQSYLTENAKYGVTDYMSDVYSENIKVYTTGEELGKMYSFIDNKNVHSFYSYRNSADASDKLAMIIHYTVGGESKTSKAFIINGVASGGTGSIDSNTIYRLYVTASVTSDELILNNIQCYVEDWKYVPVNVGSLTEERRVN